MSLAASVFGQAGMLPGDLRIGAVAGSRTAIAAPIWLYYPQGSNSEFNISIRYGSATTGWLTVSAMHGTVPIQLTVAADPTNVPVGTYSAQIIATVGAPGISTWTFVTFTVAPAGSAVGGLALSPSTLSFLPGTSSTAQTVTVTNASGTTGVRSFDVTAASVNWLSVSRADQRTPGSFDVRVFPTGMSAGIYEGSILVRDLEKGVSTVLPVTLRVPASSSGPAMTLSPAQQALIFNYQVNGPAIPTQTVYVTTNSTQYTNFTATTSAAWLGVAAASWQTPARSADCFAPGLFYVAVNPAGMTAGLYSGTVTLSASGVASVDIPVSFTISSTPVLNANPSFIGLDSSAALLTANLGVTGTAGFYFSATVSGGASWLSVTPTSAVAGTAPADLTVTANIGGLSAGTYNTTIVLTGSGGSPRLTVPVRLVVAGEAPANTLLVSPTTLSFSGITGSSVLPAYISAVSGIPSSPLDIRFAAVGDGGWLKVEPISGPTPLMAKVSVDPSAAPGSYTGSIVVTSLTTEEEEKIAVTYEMTARTISVTPKVLTFTQQQRGAAVPAQEVQVTANAVTSFRASSSTSWIRVQPTDALTTPAKVSVSVDPTGMLPGSYEGTIQLAGPNTAVVQVSFTIPQPAPPVASPTSVAFAYELGAPAPSAQTVAISCPCGSAKFTASVATESGVKWLSAKPTTGTTPGTISLQVATSELTPGQHAATVSVLVEDTPAKTLTVPVTLAVTGSAVQLREVLNSASMVPALLAPGELITLTGLGLGPAEPVVAKPTSAGAYATDLGGVRVLFDGIAAPVLVAQREQINTIVPYTIQGRTSAKIQIQVSSSYSIPVEVKIVDASPGIFTSGGTGRGQAAALNADSSRNSAVNPAPAGSIIVIYLTGEGQTDPPGQDGRIINTDLRKPLLPVTATIGGRNAEVVYAGSAPTQVSGICQVNVRIPEGLAPGTYVVEAQIGGAASQRGVTIEVR